MFGYIALVAGLLLLSLLEFFLARSIQSNSLARNNAIGLRTQATLSSDEAWSYGHQQALPYLKATVLAGIVGAAVSLVTLPSFQSHGNITEAGIYAIPSVAFVLQLGTLIWSSIKADSAAKTTLT